MSTRNLNNPSEDKNIIMASVKDFVAYDKKTGWRSTDLNQKHTVKAERSGNEVLISTKLFVVRFLNIRSNEALESVEQRVTNKNHNKKP